MNSKRITQWVIILISVGLIVFAYFSLSKPQGSAGNALSIVPGDAVFVCEIEGFAGANDEIQFLKTIFEKSEKRSCYRQWLTTLAIFDSLRASQRSWYDVLENSAIVFQSQDVYNSNNWSVSIGLHPDISGAELMKAWLPDIPKRDFKGTDMFIGTGMNWCVLNNCLVLSPAVAALEAIIIQTGKNDVLLNQETFAGSYELRGKDVPVHLIARVNETAWLPLEPVFTQQGTSLIGYLSAQDHRSSPLCVWSPPGELNAPTVLPSNTVFLDAIHSANVDSAWYAMSRYYAGSDAETFWSKAWQDLGDSCQCDLNEALLSWRTGEAGSAVIEIADSLSEAVAYMGISDTLNAIEFIRPLLAVQSTPTDGIYSIAYPIAFQRNLTASATIEPQFVMQHKGYLFAASNPRPLKAIRAATEFLVGNTSLNSALAQRNESSGRFVFQSKPEIALLPQALMALLQSASYWGITTEINHSNQLLITIGLPIRIKDSPAIQPPAAAEPISSEQPESSTLETAGRTWTVINHNTQEKETLHFDGKNQLELVGADGKTCWNLEVQGPILGDVVQVDALKNNKLQMAFATESGIYILDRNGNALPGFPHLPKPPVTSSLLVADYDNTKKYRLIFGVGDGMLMNIGVDGNPTSGWKFQALGDQKIKAVKAAKIGSDDVIFAFTEQGNILLLKRTGETKAPCTSVLEGFDGKTIDIIAGSDLTSTSIVYSSGAGVKTVQLSVQ